MRNINFRRALKISVFSVVILCGAVYLGCSADAKKTRDQYKELYEQIELFSEVMATVQSDYIKETNPKELVYGALGGMLSSLDDYSQFLDPESFREMEIETTGEFGGLGIEIGLRDGVLTVIAPMDGTPAEKAGLKSGDRIVKIDGELTRGIALTEAVKKLRGKPKTKVNLAVLRENEDKLLEFSIERGIIKLKSIKTSRMLDKEIGYIKIVEFQKNTPRDMEDKIVVLKKEGMKALILDIRNNPGGLLDVAYEVSELLLPKGATVVSLKGRVPDQNKVYKARGKGAFTDFPLVVVVNEGSASASEIVAGAMKDNKRGIILGTRTFGKGSVQTVIPLKDGSAARMTTAAYYTPGDFCISDKGVLPDVEVKLVEKKETPTEAKEDIFEKLEKEKKEEKKEERAKEEDSILYDNQLTASRDLLKGILIYKTKD